MQSKFGNLLLCEYCSLCLESTSYLSILGTIRSINTLSIDTTSINIGLCIAVRSYESFCYAVPCNVAKQIQMLKVPVATGIMWSGCRALKLSHDTSFLLMGVIFVDILVLYQLVYLIFYSKAPCAWLLSKRS